MNLRISSKEKGKGRKRVTFRRNSREGAGKKLCPDRGFVVAEASAGSSCTPGKFPPVQLYPSTRPEPDDERFSLRFSLKFLKSSCGFLRERVDFRMRFWFFTPIPALNSSLEQSGDLFAELLDLIGDLTFQSFDALF